jgi:RNA polymerase sigma factor (sigma-70 family)
MRNGSRPGRAQIEPAALDLIQRHGAQIMRTARRYSACAEDAEDAYQRGLEILLTKAPSTRESDLLPWLKTVVKHEAFALRRQRDRTPLSDDGELDSPGSVPGTDEQAERYERLRLGAEALGRLKPQEIRCLLLRAEGLSYKEICEATGWTYTKVNRCLTEGRASFLQRIAGIEAGEECERLAPQLSRLADGEATAEDMVALRPHLKSCLSCRGRLREQRSVPASVAALIPPAAFGGGSGPLGALAGWLHERVLSIALKLQAGVHQAAELGSAQKVAAVAASAAIAGGGAVAVESAGERPPAPRPVAERPAHRAEQAIAERPAPEPAADTSQELPAPRVAEPEQKPRPEPSPAEPEPEPIQEEFAPSPAERAPRPGRQPAQLPSTDTAPSEFGP